MRFCGHLSQEADLEPIHNKLNLPFFRLRSVGEECEAQDIASVDENYKRSIIPKLQQQENQWRERLLSIMPNRPVRNKRDYPRKMER